MAQEELSQREAQPNHYLTKNVCIFLQCEASDVREKILGRFHFVHTSLIEEITNVSAVSEEKLKAIGMVRFDSLTDVYVPALFVMIQNVIL